MGIARIARAVVVGLAMWTAWAAIDTAVAYAQEEEEAPEPEKPPPPPSKMKILLAYGLAIGGAGVVVVGAVSSLGSMNYVQGRLMMTNLLRTNPHQAERVAQSVKHTFFDGINAAMKMANTTGSTDPKIVPSCTAPAFDGAVVGVNLYWKSVLGRAKLGMVAVLGGTILAITSDIGATILIIIAVVAGLGFARILLHKIEIEASLTRARAEVLPELDRAIIDGRYVLSPRR